MPKIALVEYFTSSEKTLIFVVRPEDEKPIVHEVDITEKQIQQCMYKLLGDDGEKRQGSFHGTNYKDGNVPDIDFFQDLAGQLVQPFLKDVEDFEILYLVPHGWLHYLPLHAVKCSDGQFLVQKFKILYSPSATVIKYCQAKNNLRKNEGNYKSERNCLSMGVGSKNNPKEEHKLFHKEAEFVVENIFEGRGISKIDKEATKDSFIKDGADKDVIHVACHGHFDRIQPLKSGLLFSNGEKLPYVESFDSETQVVPEDMLLTAEEIFNLELNADLVTLSACVTGVNENKPGDELIGLTRALIYAGTPSVIVTLWPVHSQSALRLMEYFYKYWMGSDNKYSKVEALQKAQLDMLSADYPEQWRDPFFWAPFILVGDWL